MVKKISPFDAVWSTMDVCLSPVSCISVNFSPLAKLGFCMSQLCKIMVLILFGRPCQKGMSWNCLLKKKKKGRFVLVVILVASRL